MERLIGVCRKSTRSCALRTSALRSSWTFGYLDTWPSPSHSHHNGLRRPPPPSSKPTAAPPRTCRTILLIISTLPRRSLHESVSGRVAEIWSVFGQVGPSHDHAAVGRGRRSSKGVSGIRVPSCLTPGASRVCLDFDHINLASRLWAENLSQAPHFAWVPTKWWLDPRPPACTSPHSCRWEVRSEQKKAGKHLQLPMFRLLVCQQGCKQVAWGFGVDLAAPPRASCDQLAGAIRPEPCVFHCNHVFMSPVAATQKPAISVQCVCSVTRRVLLMLHTC